ncbi:MAG: penicillin-binding protein activator [Oxalobacteraceae bacterium]
MSYTYIKILLLCSALAGCGSVSLAPVFNDCNAAPALCAPVAANTTATTAPVPEVATSSVAPPAVAVLAPEPAHPIRIALLLPLRSETLGRAAEAVRAGFMAAHARDQDGVTVSVIGTDTIASQMLSAYNEAQASHDVIVGPLSRSSVATVARSGEVRIPTIALNQPLPAAPLPPKMLAMGLSIEDEARQVATWASHEHPGASAFVIGANIAWQRRVAKAFATEWQRLGLPAQSMELAVSDGYLNANGLAQLRTRLQNEQPALLLVAMDAGLTRQLRQAIGTAIPVYGTSQLNPFVSPDSVAAVDNAESIVDPLLEGLHLVDMPWQLQPDHPAVMAYPRLVTGADRKDNPDLERLYALGIDAYRVAHEIALAHEQFEIDGVTGRLSVTFGHDQAGIDRIDRIAPQAVYQDGAMLLLPGVR